MVELLKHLSFLKEFNWWLVRKIFVTIFWICSSDFTPVEEPEKDCSTIRSPKRQSSSSTVYDRVRAKLSRSLSTSATSPFTSKPSKNVDKENRRLSIDKIILKPSSIEFETVKLRSPNVLRSVGRRCHSELTSASTAELLAQFVASRLNETLASSNVVETDQSTPTKIHTPLPRSTEETTRPIMSVHKETGILQVTFFVSAKNWCFFVCENVLNYNHVGLFISFLNLADNHKLSVILC